MPTSDELKQELRVLLQLAKDKQLEIKEQLKVEKQREKCETCDMCHGSGRMYMCEGLDCDCIQCGGYSGGGFACNITSEN